MASMKFCFVVRQVHLAFNSIFPSKSRCIFNNSWSQQRFRNLNAFSRLFSSEQNDTTSIDEKTPPPKVKKRIPRKKSTVGAVELDKEKFLVVAYCTAEEYTIPSLLKAINKQGLYSSLTLPSDIDDVLHVTANYQLVKEPRHVYFFSEGTVVFWNVPELEQKSIMRFLKPHQSGSYQESLVFHEKEDFDYFYTENETKLSNGSIFLKANSDTQLETYTFSNSLALSVKLALWEASLESFVDSIQVLTQNMRHGKKLKLSQAEIYQKRGELFALRHVINLSSDLLDAPDFYWDRQHLERIYYQMYSHLNIAKRTRVMNERLNYCTELIDLLGNHLNDRHHIRLEWMIIVLIMVEVMFEFAYFIERSLRTS